MSKKLHTDWITNSIEVAAVLRNVVITDTTNVEILIPVDVLEAMRSSGAVVGFRFKYIVGTEVVDVKMIGKETTAPLIDIRFKK